MLAKKDAGKKWLTGGGDWGNLLGRKIRAAEVGQPSTKTFEGRLGRSLASMHWSGNLDVA